MRGREKKIRGVGEQNKECGVGSLPSVSDVRMLISVPKFG